MSESEIAAEVTRSFTRKDGQEVLNEAITFLEKAEGALRENEYLLANAWVDHAKDVLNDQDVFAHLVSLEIAEAKRAAGNA